MIQKETFDPVIAEIHKIRREIAERFSGNIAAIAEDAARRQSASGRPVWKRKDDNQSGQESVRS
jgi:hypothetical protein